MFIINILPSPFLFWSYKITKYKEPFSKVDNHVSRFEKNTNNIQNDPF